MQGSVQLNPNAASGPRSNNKLAVNAVSAKANFAINLFFILYTIACIIPLILVISVSFSDEKEILVHGYDFIPRQFSAYAYEFLFKDWVQIVRSYGVSIFVTVVGTLLSVTIMALYAYPISRNDFPHKSFFSFFMFFTMLFNGGLVPTYLVFTQVLHLKDNLFALILPYIVLAFFVLILRTFFANTIPMALIESAKIDGASEFRIFWKIILPLSLPVIATVALFQTLTYWNDWFQSLLYITNAHNVSLQYLMLETMLNIQYLANNSQAAQAISLQGGIQIPQETVRMAMAVIGIGPIIFAYPFFQKYFVQGLTVGAVKG